MSAFLNNPPPKVDIKQENEVPLKANESAADQGAEENISYIRYPIGYVLKQEGS